jgi:hypothetical protein
MQNNLIKQNISDYQNKKRKYFKGFYKYFPSGELFSFEAYADIYLKHFGTRYLNYIYDFCLLLQNRGIYFQNSCQVQELLWNRLTYGDFNKFKPKIRNNIDQMNGVQFEVFLSKFFTYIGYYVQKTPLSNDYGADLIMQKSYIKYVVQAKRQKKTVGVKAVQQVTSARIYYNANEAMVITSNRFSKNAIILARKSNVELWGGEYLNRKLKQCNFEIC